MNIKLIKSAAKIMSIIAISSIFLSSTGFADTTINDLIPRPGTGESPGAEDITSKFKELTNIGNLPDVSFESVASTVIKAVLGWAMLLTIIALVVAAIYYLQSQGQEEDITKAKNILIYLVVGMLIMAAAYGIVSGISKFQFFQ